MARTPSTTKSACVVMRIETEAARPSTVEEPGVLGVDRRHGARVAPVSDIDQERGHVVITLDDLEYSYPDDGDRCYYCGRKWDSHSPWEFFYLDNHLLCEECAPEYRRARSRRETKPE